MAWLEIPADGTCAASVETGKLTRGYIQKEIPNNVSSSVTSTPAADLEFWNKPKYLQFSPSVLEARGMKSATQSQKIHLGSFLPRSTIWQVLLGLLDGKKYVQ